MQKTLIYIDIRTKAQVRVTGSNANLSDYAVIERGQWQVLCVQFVDRIVDTSGVATLVPVNFDSGSSFLLVGDNNFDDEDSLMFKSYQSTIPFDNTNPESNRFNIEGDWLGGEFVNGEWVETTNYTADLSKGQMSIRVNADTQKFIDALGNKERLNNGLYINIKQYITGIDNPSTIAWFKFVASNTVRDWSDATENVPEGSNITPFIDSYLRNPIEMEFSVDGSSWHKEQTAEDEYYHFRIANTSTQYSSPVYIAKGTNGKDGKSVKIQYSNDNSSWHDTAIDGDKYIRTSVDDGVTWSAGLLFKGADGVNGEPGEDGTPAGFGTPTANVTTLETGSNATVSVTASGEDTAKVFTFEFGIPKGERGDSFTPDAIGDTAEKSNYDGEAKGFAFLDSTESKLYFKLSDDSGDWSEGTPFGKGDKGDTGEPAGFGVPTATVNTLEADSSATVSVTATGENTSKVFSFVFGIPKGKDGANGKDGETPVRGTDYYTEADKEELLTELKAYVDENIANGEW